MAASVLVAKKAVTKKEEPAPVRAANPQQGEGRIFGDQRLVEVSKKQAERDVKRRDRILLAERDNIERLKRRAPFDPTRGGFSGLTFLQSPFMFRR